MLILFLTAQACTLPWMGQEAVAAAPTLTATQVQPSALYVTGPADATPPDALPPDGSHAHPAPTNTPTPTLTPTLSINAPPPPCRSQTAGQPGGDLPDNIVNILVLGSDAHPGGGYRTDVIVLVSINRNQNTVSMVSFPRDLYVNIRGSMTNRINAAQAAGGFYTMQNTFESNFGCDQPIT